MSDFIEFVLGLLNVGNLIENTGEWVLSRASIHSNLVVEFVVGLFVWAAGICFLIAAIVMLAK